MIWTYLQLLIYLIQSGWSCFWLLKQWPTQNTYDESKSEDVCFLILNENNTFLDNTCIASFEMSTFLNIQRSPFSLSSNICGVWHSTKIRSWFKMNEAHIVLYLTGDTLIENFGVEINKLKDVFQSNRRICALAVGQRCRFCTDNRLFFRFYLCSLMNSFIFIKCDSIFRASVLVDIGH